MLFAFVNSGTGNFTGSGLWPSSGTSTNRCTRFSFLRNVSFFFSCGKTLKEANSCPPGSLRHNRTDRKRYDGDYEKFRRTTTTSKLLQTSAQACAVCVAPSIRDDRTTRFSSNVIRRRGSLALVLQGVDRQRSDLHRCGHRSQFSTGERANPSSTMEDVRSER